MAIFRAIAIQRPVSVDSPVLECITMKISLATSWIKSVLVLLLLVLLTACGSTNIGNMGGRDRVSLPPVSVPVIEPPLITTLDWTPNYTQPIRFMETLLTEQNDERAKGRTITQIAYLYDAQLYVLFHELLDYLPDTARVREVQEQNSWLDARQEVVSESFTRNGGGDAGSFHAADMFIAQTQQRQSLIEQRLSRVKIE